MSRSPIGSLTITITMGIVLVTFLAARVAAVASATITCGSSRTSSPASEGSRSYRPSAKRVRDDQVLPRHPAPLSERLLERLKLLLPRSGAAPVQEPDPIDLTCLLRLVGERRKNSAKSEPDREPDSPHQHLG